MTTPREQLTQLLIDHEIYLRLKDNSSDWEASCTTCEFTTEAEDEKMFGHTANTIIQAGWTPPKEGTS